MLTRGRARGIDRGRLADDQHRLGGQQTGGGLGIDAGHHFEVRRDMNIGEVAQRLAGAPVGQIVQREMDHHRARAGAEMSARALG